MTTMNQAKAERILNNAVVEISEGRDSADLYADCSRCQAAAAFLGANLVNVLAGAVAKRAAAVAEIRKSNAAFEAAQGWTKAQARAAWNQD